MDKFSAISVSSKFAICGLPLRYDSYRTCSFGCLYCFSENRVVAGHKQDLCIADIPSLGRRLRRVYDDKNFEPTNFTDVLLSHRITWHQGGMSDPFQPCEDTYHITAQAIDLMKRYDISCLFSTKSDTIYGAEPDPDLHTFHLSVTNTQEHSDWEPNVPPNSSRKRFYHYLKDNGFKVGIRIQPFIPGLTTPDIIDDFCDQDNFTIEGLKIVPQNKQCAEYIYSHTNLKPRDFVQMGLLNLGPNIRYQLYRPYIDRLESYGLKWSVSDNDMRMMGNNDCCCGDNLIHRQTGIDTTAFIRRFGKNYSKEEQLRVIDTSEYGCCKCNHLFTSNRQEGCTTVREFYDKRYDRESSFWSPKSQKTNANQRNLDDY